MVERDAHRTCSRPFVYHDVYHIVLHGGIEILFHFGGEAVDLIDEEDVSLLERGEKAGEVAGLVKHRTGSDLHVHSHLVGDDMCKGGLSKARRTMEKGMVQSLPAEFGSLYIDIQVGDDLPLAGKIFQLLGADNSVQFLIFAVVCIVGVEVGHIHRSFTNTNIYFIF